MEQFETLKWYEMIGKRIIYTHWGVPSCEASPCGAQSDKLLCKPYENYTYIMYPPIHS
jgi:hypothetical protein